MAIGSAGVGVGYPGGPSKQWGVWGGLEGASEGCPGDEGMLQGLLWAPPAFNTLIMKEH